MPRLRYSVADADAIYQTLIGPAGFKKENILLLTDKTERKPTLRNIKWALGTFLARSAHKDDTGDDLLRGPRRLRGGPARRRAGRALQVPGPESTPTPTTSTRPRCRWTRCRTIFGRIEAERMVVFLDACYSGAAGGRTFASSKTRAVTVDDLFLDRLTRSKGRAIVTASRPSEVSIELAELGHGIFTYYLVRGLQGAADLNRDGIVTPPGALRVPRAAGGPEVARGGRQPAPGDEGRAGRRAAAHQGARA